MCFILFSASSWVWSPIREHVLWQGPGKRQRPVLHVHGSGLILPEAPWRDSSEEQKGQMEKGKHVLQVEGAVMCRVSRGM